MSQKFIKTQNNNSYSSVFGKYFAQAARIAALRTRNPPPR